MRRGVVVVVVAAAAVFIVVLVAASTAAASTRVLLLLRVAQRNLTPQMADPNFALKNVGIFLDYFTHKK